MFLLYFLSKLINSLYKPFVKNTEKEIGHVNGTFIWVIYKFLYTT